MMGGGWATLEFIVVSYWCISGAKQRFNKGVVKACVHFRNLDMILSANPEQNETEISGTESNTLKLEEKHCNAYKRSMFTSNLSVWLSG